MANHREIQWEEEHNFDPRLVEGLTDDEAVPIVQRYCPSKYWTPNKVSRMLKKKGMKPVFRSFRTWYIPEKVHGPS